MAISIINLERVTRRRLRSYKLGESLAVDSTANMVRRKKQPSRHLDWTGMRPWYWCRDVNLCCSWYISCKVFASARSKAAPNQSFPRHPVAQASGSTWPSPLLLIFRVVVRVKNRWLRLTPFPNQLLSQFFPAKNILSFKFLLDTTSNSIFSWFVAYFKDGI